MFRRVGLLQLGYFVKVRRHELYLKKITINIQNPKNRFDIYPSNVVSDIQLLVLGMGAVIASSDRQQKHVLTSGLLEGYSDRNRAAFSSQIGFYVVDVLGGLDGRGVVRVGGVFGPRMSSVSHVYLKSEMLYIF